MILTAILALVCLEPQTGLWRESSPLQDACGGMVLGGYSVIQGTNAPFSYGFNSLALWGFPCASAHIGTPPLDLSFLQSNVGLYGVGDDIGTGESLDRCRHIFYWGDCPGKFQSLSVCYDVYNSGDNPGYGQACTNSWEIYNGNGYGCGENQVVNASHSLFNKGHYAGSRQDVTGSAFAFNDGKDCGWNQTLLSCAGIWNVVASAGYGQYLVGCSNILNLGFSAGAFQRQTNCANIIEIGKDTQVNGVGLHDIMLLGPGARGTNSGDVVLASPEHARAFPSAAVRVGMPVTAPRLTVGKLFLDDGRLLEVKVGEPNSAGTGRRVLYVEDGPPSDTSNQPKLPPGPKQEF